MKPAKLMARLAQGQLQNVAFEDLVRLAQSYGFARARVSGSHHIFIHTDIHELLNLQEVSGQGKPYQIRQFLRLLERYNLRMKDDR